MLSPRHMTSWLIALQSFNMEVRYTQNYRSCVGTELAASQLCSDGVSSIISLVYEPPTPKPSLFTQPLYNKEAFPSYGWDLWSKTTTTQAEIVWSRGWLTSTYDQHDTTMGITLLDHSFWVTIPKKKAILNIEMALYHLKPQSVWKWDWDFQQAHIWVRSRSLTEVNMREPKQSMSVLSMMY